MKPRFTLLLGRRQGRPTSPGSGTPTIKKPQVHKPSQDPQAEVFHHPPSQHPTRSNVREPLDLQLWSNPWPRGACRSHHKPETCQRQHGPLPTSGDLFHMAWLSFALSV
ncbi:hypothetical protein DSO57_1025112 [Entomophthora muscae]|uniref:Uncharacterized protein n=1 Tax=Entomophthora muscae TaxID=34485 RepID=A0ACC2UM87_9FUNG|nr:hypothetical protein DSO57_1025112 [Entomophthora muscae]